MNLAENDWLWIAWTHVWQVTVLIAAVALLVRLVAANRPQLAFALWLVVFVKCITPPLWSSPAGAFCWLQPMQATIAQDSPAALTVVLLPADAGPSLSHADSDLPRVNGNGKTCHGFFERFDPCVWLASIWAVGGVAVLAITVVQRRRVAKLIRRADANASVAYTAMLASLAHRLRIRWSVRLVVTESLGPAVLGLIRPTILLPRAAIDGRSADEIELILAHELMHVRRGDLWIALLRSLVLSLWWFHPLVWWAGRRASREAERCCDDAVLAELRCSPAHYARCLLDVLEIKHQLLSLPAFPGVRAIEVNQGRLERIMKIGHGGYRQTPWWCWGVALFAAFAVLPGAAIHTSAGEGDAISKSATSPASVPYPLDANGASANSGPDAGDLALGDKTPPDTVYYTKTYSVKDVLSKLRKEERGALSGPDAKEGLSQLVRCSITNSMAGSAGDRRNRPQPEQVLWLNDDELVVGANNAGHKRVADTLNALRKYGVSDQIAIETRFVTIPDDVLQRALPDWSPLNANEAASAGSDAVWPASFDRPLSSHEGTCVARAQLLIEKSPPVRFRIMDQDQGEKLIEWCENDARSNVLQAPKVTVFNGQTACVSDTAHSPFVVGVVTGEGQESPVAPQPQIRVVSEGTVLQLRPIADQSGAIHLDFAATFSRIRKVETVSLNRTRPNGATVQIPEVASIRMEGGAELKPGQWLLLSGSDMTNQMTATKVAPVSWKDWLLSGGKRQKQPQPPQFLMMLRAEKIQPAHAATNPALPLAERDSAGKEGL